MYFQMHFIFEFTDQVRRLPLRTTGSWFQLREVRPERHKAVSFPHPHRDGKNSVCHQTKQQLYVPKD